MSGLRGGRLAAALFLSLGAHAAALGILSALAAPAASAGAGGTALPGSLQVSFDIAQAAPPARSGEKAAPARVPHPLRYVPASRLDKRPEIRTDVMPKYPRGVMAGTRGRVVLELYIAKDGSLDAVKVARAEPKGVFDKSAADAFAGASFSPGMQRGVAVPTLLKIEVRFGD